jgi:SRSO17 transposase
MTVGVARQHAGITGQVENCQTVVFAAYVTARGHAPFDFRLYLPRAWCADAARRQRAAVPDDVEFATKTGQGTEMVTAAVSGGVPFAFLAGDEVYGRSSKLRAACEKHGKGYVLAVPVNFTVTLPSRRRVTWRPWPAWFRPPAGRPARAALAARATVTTPGPGRRRPHPATTC